jgi:hypothetical protein
VSLLPTITLAKSQHGGTVRGSALVPAAESGSRLEVDLLASRASLAQVKRSAPVRIGRFVRAAVGAGRVSFSVSLDDRAKRTLRRHGRLSVVVQVTLTPPHGAPATKTGRVLLLG